MSEIFINSNSEFYNTYQIYREYLGYDKDKPYTYKQWMRLPDNQKAAALYCQFYNEITLAWYKVYTKWSLESEGISYFIEILLKNVEKIKKDKKRFNPRYIYKVAWNAFYIICIDPSKNKTRYYSETSSTFSSGEDELDWFDVLGYEEDSLEKSKTTKIQKLIDNMNQPTQVYFEYVLGNISEYTAARYWKKLNIIDGNLRDKEYVNKIVNKKCKEYQKTLQSIFLNTQLV